MNGCMHECMHACMCIHMHACMHVFVCACMHALCVCARAFTCMYVCMYVCMNLCICICMHACMHACMNACIRYMYRYIHAQTNTLTYTGATQRHGQCRQSGQGHAQARRQALHQETAGFFFLCFCASLYVRKTGARTQEDNTASQSAASFDVLGRRVMFLADV